MRQHRLIAVHEFLNQDESIRLDTAVLQFEQTVQERIIRVEQKGIDEVGIRMRQWDRSVATLLDKPIESIPYYATIAENRVMLAELFKYLQQAPYQLDEKWVQETAVIDQALKAHWQAGAFIWPNVWQPAYPQDNYWWLYGQPVTSK